MGSGADLGQARTLNVYSRVRSVGPAPGKQVAPDAGSAFPLPIPSIFSIRNKLAYGPQSYAKHLRPGSRTTIYKRR